MTGEVSGIEKDEQGDDSCLSRDDELLPVGSVGDGRAVRGNVRNN